MTTSKPQPDQRPPLPPLTVPIVTGSTAEDLARLRAMSAAGRRAVERLQQEQADQQPPADEETPQS